MSSSFGKVRYVDLEGKLDGLVSRIRKVLEKRKEVKLAFLFGSSLERKRASDVDVAIYASPKLSFKEFLELGAELEHAAKVPVDLVQKAGTFHPSAPRFRPEVQVGGAAKGGPLLVRD